MSQTELLTDFEQRVAIEISRLWSGTDKRNEQRADREAQLSLFSQTAAKYPSTVIHKVVSNWLEDQRWWPTAVKDFEDALKAAQTAAQPLLPNHNDPWAKILAASPREWSSQLVELYEDQHRGLSLRQRMDLQSQAMNMVRDKGAGSFGINGKPIWSPHECLEKTRYA